MKKYLVIVFLNLFNVLLFANGGIPYNSIDAEPAKITLANDKELILDKEQLTIKFIDDFAIVKCKYEIINTSKNTKKINFAFNIPITVGQYQDYKYCLLYYKIFENQKELDFITKKEVIEETPFENIYEIWNQSSLTFSSEERKQLEIVYKTRTNTWARICNAKYDSNTFVYNLFPATSFGNGIITEFELTIDKTELLIEEGKILKISGLNIQNEEKTPIQTYKFNNFDLTKNPVLKIEYDINGYYIANYIQNPYEYGVMRNVVADSELKEGTSVYSAKNLIDGSYSTPWVEGASDFGKNQKIKLNLFGNPSKFSAFNYETVTHLYLLNGFRKNEKTYYENNRIKTLKLWVNGKDCGTLELKDRPFKVINDFNFAYEADLLNNERLNKVKSIEIEILDVYKGTKYNDTCISEIVVLDVDIPTN